MRSGIWRWHYLGRLDAMRSSFNDGARLLPRPTTDTRFRAAARRQQSCIPVSAAGRYALVNNPGFGTHTFELLCPGGLAASAFTFTSCVDFSIAGAATGVPARS